MIEKVGRNVPSSVGGSKILSEVEGLTTKAKTAYPKSGDIFMAEGGEGPKKITSDESALRQKQGNESGTKNDKFPVLTGQNGELKELPAAESLEEQTSVNKYADTDYLIEEYKKLRDFSDTENNEGVSEALRPRIAEVLHSLEERGVDVMALAKEPNKDLPKNFPARSLGARTKTAEEIELQKTAKDLLESTFLKEYQNFLKNVSAIGNPAQIEELVTDFYSARKKAFDRIIEEKEKLWPETAETLLEKKMLEGQEERLEAEYKNIYENLVGPALDKEGRNRASGLSQIERKIVDRIDALKGEKDRATDETEKRRITIELREQISLINRDPEDAPIPDELLRAITTDGVMAEKFLSKLIVSDLEDEPHQLRGFYGPINHAKLLRLSRGEDYYDRLLTLSSANSEFHNMNYVIKRSFDQFSQRSQALLPKHFQLLAGISGVDTVLRYYEEYAQEILSKETKITEESVKQMDEYVRRRFEETLDAKDKGGRYLIESIAGGKMGEANEDKTDWEAFRAFIYGRNFFRIIVRQAEHTVLSELPPANDPSLYTSSPQKEFVQILNTLKLIGFRFNVEETLGGPELLNDALKANRDQRREKGKVRLNTIQGTDVDQREFQQVVAARGVMATWRNAETVLRQINFYDNGKLTNVVQFFLDHKEKIDGLSESSERTKFRSNEEKATHKGKLKKETAELFAPLLDNVSIALGVLCSGNGLNGITPELKELIWEKAVNLNPLVIASLITRMEVDDKSSDKSLFKEGETLARIGNREIKDYIPQVKSLEDILLEAWGTDEQKNALGEGKMRKLKIKINAYSKELNKLTAKDESKRSKVEESRINTIRKNIDQWRMEYKQKDLILKKVLSCEQWEKMTNKLRLANEFRVREETERMKNADPNSRPKSLGELLTDDYGLKLMDDEQKVLRGITQSGEKITSDLASIKMSQTWFLNDTPFKDLDWIKLGQFYDRETGDLGNFQKSASAILKFISNPFGQSTDEVLKGLEEAITSASQIIGRKAAQDYQKIIFKTYLHKIYERPRYRALWLSGARHTFKKPTSRAQEIIGISAPAKNEDGIQEILDKSLKPGILRLDVKDQESGKKKWSNTYKEFMDEFGTEWYERFFWPKARDLGPFFAIGFLWALFKSFRKK